MQSATHLVDTEHVQVDEVWMEKGLSPDQVLREEIRLLAIRVLSIDESFHVIEKNLVRATQIKMLPREVLDAVDALVPKWKALSKRFRDTVWRSREVAGRARQTVEVVITFLEQILCDTSDLVATKKRINDYAKDINDPSESAKNLVDTLIDLSREVTGFKENWEEVVKEGMILVSGEVKELNRNIDILTDKIKSYQMVLEDLSRAPAIFSLATNAISFISSMCPAWWNRSCVSFFPNHSQTAPLDKTQRGYQDQLREMMENKDRKTEELTGISKLDALLSESGKDFNNVKEKMDCISNIWGHIRADLYDAAIHLETITQNKTEEQAQFDIQFFDKRLEVTRKLYNIIADILREYEAAVNPQANLFKT